LNVLQSKTSTRITAQAVHILSLKYCSTFFLSRAGELTEVKMLNNFKLKKKITQQVRFSSNHSNAPVIVSATRTPIGSAWGSLSKVKGTQLGSIAVKAALERGSMFFLYC
jgi:hypothetical protein